MDKLESGRRGNLEKLFAGEVDEVKKGKGRISLSKVMSSGMELLDKVPSQYITGRSTKSTRQRQQEEKTAPVEFSLFAPYNKRAAVRGDFSEWNDVDLEKGDDGYFRTTIDLADGDYEYKFCVESNSPWQLGEWICITDPMATDVNDHKNDNGIIHVRNGQTIVDQYEWRHDMDPLPPDVELVIYEMHVGDFGGNFNGVVDRLDYLSSLGINAIELMPVSEFPGDKSWGYNPRHFYAVENAYGNSTDLKNLVDECHARGMRVIMDLVANHGQDENPLAQVDHNYWFVENNTDAYQYGPKYDYNHWDDNLKLFPARKFMNEVAFYWATEFHLDGIRFDATALIDNFDFLHWLGEAVKQASGMKPFYLVAEHLPIDPAIVGYGKPMDGLWNDYFYWQMTANMRESEFSGWQPFDWEKTKDAIQPARNDLIGPTAAVNYISNHDHNRLMFELQTAGIEGDKAFRKAKLAAAVTLTSVGIPMVWMGEEFGETWDKSIEPRPLHWELLESGANSDLYHYYSGLIYLRKTSGPLKTENIEFFHLDEANKVLAWKRWDDQGGIVAVVANFSDSALGDYAIPGFPADGDWHEFSFDYDKSVEGGQMVDFIGPSECKIYIKK
jgi:1,4-alpha-glucan branching enzyme